MAESVVILKLRNDRLGDETEMKLGSRWIERLAESYSDLGLLKEVSRRNEDVKRDMIVQRGSEEI